MSYDIYISADGEPKEEDAVRLRHLDDDAKRFAQQLSARDPRLEAWEAATIIELTRRDAPIQVSIWSDEAVVTIGFGTGDQQSVVGEALGYVRDIQRQFGWKAYDPQLERELRLPDDLDDVKALFFASSDTLRTFGRPAS